MAKIFSALLLVLPLSLIGQDQTLTPSTSSKKFGFGVKVGANFYDNYQPGSTYYISRPGAGLHGGIYGDYSLGEKILGGKLFIRLEGLFSTRGMNLQTNAGSTGSQIKYNRQSAYIDIPVSVNYKLWRGLEIHVGAISSIFLNEYRSVTTSNGYKATGSDEFKSYERWQFGACAGLAYNFKLLNQNFAAGARASMGLTNTNQILPNVRASQDPKYMMAQVFITYKVFEF